MLLVTVVLMDILVGMEFDLFVPSFSELQNQFNLSPFWVEALLSINFIGFCPSLFIVGKLADRYGRKPILLLGIMIFIIGTSFCLWASFYPFLLVGRFLQGVGVASPMILSFLIIADNYTVKKQQYLMAILNGVMNISAGIAPVLGSYITLYFHWQGNFRVLLLLAFITLAMTMLFIPNRTPSEQTNTISLGGYSSIFRSKPLILLIVHFICLFAPYWVFVGMTPLLYMGALGVSLSQFGYYQGSMALIFAFGSIGYGLIINKYDRKKMLHISNLILIISFVMIILLSFLDSRNPLFITLAFILFCIGQIVPTIILYPLCLNLIPQAKGRVSATIQGGRFIFSGLSLQLGGYCYVGSFQNIGIITAFLILPATITLFLVLKDRDLKAMI